MLTIYDKTSSGLVRHNETAPIGADTVWFDLLDPTPEEDASVEQALGISVPTRAEMREIEASSRFYQENGASYMTAYVLNNVEQPMPDGTAMTFIVAGHRLVTVRYADPKAFPQYIQRIEKGEATCGSGPAILVGLMETHIERMADLIERIQDEVDELAVGVFDIKGRRTKARRLDVLLKGVGKEGDIVARVQESASSLDRVLHFMEHTGRSGSCDQRTLERIDAAERDVTSLMEHMKFLTNRIQFLLDAALGMITTEQNQIIKLFSVMAVMLMPPTLVASVYGMNFRHMPELDWLNGYWMALGLMVFSAVIPFIYFKRKGWL
jgi:magnesium transporter